MLKEQRSLGKHLTAVLLVISLQCGCAKVDLKPKDKSSTTTTTTTTTAPGADDPSQMQVGQIPNSVNGDWTVGFQFNKTTAHSTMHLEQSGQLFHGKGTDDSDGSAFTIDSGTISNGQVRFYKKYQGLPPVEYSGKIEVVDEANYHGPYMGGEFTSANNGKIDTGIWESEMLLAGKSPPASANQPPPNAPPPAQPQGPPPAENLPNWPTDHNPDLSGKWEVGFEYNFHTIRSTMYLEQDGDKVTGHGIDANTGEKFVIEAGWYHYPKLTIVRKYNKPAEPKGKPKGKGKGKTPLKPKSKGVAAIGSMTFKAQVSVVNDKDYQGPYLSGKTQGGGNWEAQLVK